MKTMLFLSQIDLWLMKAMLFIDQIDFLNQIDLWIMKTMFFQTPSMSKSTLALSMSPSTSKTQGLPSDRSNPVDL